MKSKDELMSMSIEELDVESEIYWDYVKKVDAVKSFKKAIDKMERMK